MTHDIPAAVLNAHPRMLRQRVLYRLVVPQVVLALIAALFAVGALLPSAPFGRSAFVAAAWFAWLVVHVVTIVGLWRGRAWALVAAFVATMPCAVVAGIVAYRSFEAGGELWPAGVCFVSLIVIAGSFLMPEARGIFAAHRAARSQRPR